MQAADALSLTNRLKRAQILGADVKHLSRSTVAGVLADVGKQLRAVPSAGHGPHEEGQRRELRALLVVLRELFGALGEVVFDPASAGRVSEAAMDPEKARARAAAEEPGTGEGGKAAGWMAPLSKLFTGGAASSSPAPHARAESERAVAIASPRPMPPPRFVPKLGPALAASATTVNVEFSGAASPKELEADPFSHLVTAGAAPQILKETGSGCPGIE
ncbi:hypothetical protein C8R47DRAFT_1178957 [Mycena vitilis]|nr:hypothetical protein C8R47DRAFT_1178957 [Mycena vitilis]